jgi:hypothetical protein
VGDIWDSIGNVNEINTQIKKKKKKRVPFMLLAAKESTVTVGFLDQYSPMH